MPRADSSATTVARPRPKVRPLSITPAVAVAMALAASRAPRRGVMSIAGMMVLCRYSPPAEMMPSTSMATEVTAPNLSIW